jgi:RNA polymerase sigma factor FliA
VDKKNRDELVLKYTPLVKSIVGRVTAKLPIHAADKEDLVHVGVIGLMSALSKYDESRNVQFETYARFRIRGAILDELRMRDWVPRSTRGKDSMLEKAYRTLEKQLGRPPEDEEVAALLGIDLEEYFRILDEARGVSLINSEDLPPEYMETHGQYDVLESIQRDNPFGLLSNRELKEKLKQAIDGLPAKERLVLSLYYYEELTMKEIGAVLDLTESRVCQVHAQAVIRLRATVKDLR